MTNSVESLDNTLEGDENFENDAKFSRDRARKLRIETEALERQLEEKADLEKAKKRRRQTVLISQLVTCIVGLAVSFLLFYADLRGMSLGSLIEKNAQTMLAFAILFLSGLWITLINANNFGSFQDVDIRQRIGFRKKVAAPAAWPFPTSERPTYDEIDDFDEQTIKTDYFYEHFIRITGELEERASNAEEKASILLDKGTTYTIAGIIFFVLSIITWQVVAWVKGFQTEFIYGIASCATLFIFIEFLSAWFLRQYRHFIDTATYLLKVKSIFDRFALIYLAGKTIPDHLEQAKLESMNTLFRMLEEQIKWPDSYLLKKPETSFANDAVNAMTALTKDLRKAQKKMTQREAVDSTSR